MSLREISKRMGYHYNTVKKYADKEEWNKGMKPRKKRGSLLEPLYGVIDGWLKEDLKRKAKYRRTGTKIYNDLRSSEEYGELLKVGRQTVINYVSRRKEELNKQTYKTAMFGLHSLCEAQVDFGEVLVETGKGAEEKWRELIVCFPWSNAGFLQVCRRETKECLCEALIKIFEFIGGVPTRILFDNMSSAVVSVQENGERELTEMFMRFTMHHRFKAEFCNPESPQEKGNVENKVGYLRRNLLLPPPKIETQSDLDELNKRLLDECMKDLEREHYVKKERMTELWETEQKKLQPLPRERFRVFTLQKIKTDKYSFVQFDNNSYSTSPEYPEREMWLEIGASELRILNEKYEVIATHERRPSKESEPIIDFENYIGTLSRKPRAFLNSPYFLTLPEKIQAFLKSLTYPNLKKMLLILTPIIQDGKIDDAEAVFGIVEIKNPDDFDAAYRALTENNRPQPSVVTPLTPPQTPYLPKLDRYTELLKRGENL
jgi:transposase